MVLRDVTIPASRREALPIVTHPQSLTLHLNRHTIAVHHADWADTEGDSIAHFREADVLHHGDRFFSGIYRFIGLSGGGRVDGVIAATDRALEIAGPRTKTISGHGPRSTRAELTKCCDVLIQIRDRVRKLIGEGKDRAVARLAVFGALISGVAS